MGDSIAAESELEVIRAERAQRRKGGHTGRPTTALGIRTPGFGWAQGSPMRRPRRHTAHLRVNVGHVCTDNVLEITRLRARDHLVESDAGTAARNRSEHEPPGVKRNEG